MRRRPALVAAAASAAALCAALAVTGGGALAATAQATRATRAAALTAPAVPASDSWGTAQVVNAPGSKTATDVTDAMACASAGNCAAGGEYTADGNNEAFVITEGGGLWGQAEEVPGTAKLNTSGLAEVTSVACPLTGYCTAGGFYSSSSQDNQLGFVVDESDGVWGNAQAVRGLAAVSSNGQTTVSVVSCSSAGNCSAGGSYLGNAGQFQAFVVSEKNGTWGKAEPVPGTVNLNLTGHANVNSLSCASAGSCVAVGYYSGGFEVKQAFIDTEANGTWGSAQAVNGIATLSGDKGAAQANWVSCPSASNCTAIGTEWNGSSNVDEAFVTDEQNGSWQPAKLVPGLADLPGSGYSSGTAVSCASAGDCSAAGGYGTGGTDSAQDFVATESDGTWTDAEEMPGIASLNLGDYAEVTSMSCGSAGNCTVGGYYSSVSGEADFDHAAFVADETDGTWQSAQQVQGTAVTPPSAQVSSVSCPSASYCAASGSYPDGGFVVTRSTLQQTSTAVTLSAATVTYGDEQAEHVSVQVTPETSGSPTGTVTVKHSGATVCTITLAAAAGSCVVPATRLSAGKVTVTAVYEGNSDFGASSSAAKSLTVSKASSKASLTLSAPKVTYGHEGSEHLSVEVKPRYSGTPGGTVKVKSGRNTVCVITLKSGKGSCVLAAKKLKAGTYHLVASYGGNADFAGANSGARTLTVAK
jgi:hypothetical protein